MGPSGEAVGSDPLGVFCDLWGMISSVLDDLEPTLSVLGISPKAFFLLQMVEEHPSPAELSRRMHLPPPTVTYLIKQIEAQGYLERRAVPGDLRRFHLAPTLAGLEAIRLGSAAISAVFAARMARLDTGDLTAFARAVKRMTAPNDEPT